MKVNTISLLLAILSLTGQVLGTWTTPVPLTEVNVTPGEDWTPFLSFDGLTLYTSRVRTSSFYHGRIYKATREQPSGPFTSVTEISELNRPDSHVLAPWVSPDNLRMYYYTEESSGWRLRFSERASVDDPWPQGTSIIELNEFARYNQTPKLTEDELTIFFGSYGPGGVVGGSGSLDIWMATRPERNLPFSDIKNLEEINTEWSEISPSPTPDGLELYFTSNRNGAFQIFKASRESATDPFSNVEHLSFLDIPGGHSAHPFLSSDGTAIYFRGQPGPQSSRDIYVSYIPEPAAFALLGLGAVMLRIKRSRHTT